MKIKNKEYSEKELKELVNQSHSIKELSEKLGYVYGAYTTMKKIIKNYNLDISHFVKREEGYNKKELNYFQKDFYVKPSTLFKYLVDLRGKRCEVCGIDNWCGKEIKLEVHHIDGDRMNNSLDNVQLLCPNCHSQTNNWRGKNITKKHIDENLFIETLKASKSIREALIKLKLAPKGGNYERAKKIILKYDLNIKNDLKREVVQLELESNKIINKFKNIAEANRSLGLKSNNSTIRKCIMGVYDTAYGYKWELI